MFATIIMALLPETAVHRCCELDQESDGGMGKGWPDSMTVGAKPTLQMCLSTYNEKYLWKNGVKHGFPVRLLRVLNGLYGNPLLDECVTGVSPIISGGVHATSLIEVEPVDTVELFASVVVHNTEFQVVDESNYTSRQLRRGVEDLCVHVETAAGWRSSRTTRQCVTTMNSGVNFEWWHSSGLARHG